MTTTIASAQRPGAVPAGRAPGLSHAEMWTAFARSDGRYDGRFVTAVRTTGIFCRPSCTCRKPRPERVVFFRTADAASRAGFRACKRCRPEFAGGVAEAERRMAERALAFMRAHHEERLILADLGRALAMSPTNFARRFRAAAGESPMRALADVRAERAETLLATSAQGVLDVALACGFGSASALVRAFRRRTGMTPAAWRARIRNGGTG